MEDPEYKIAIARGRQKIHEALMLEQLKKKLREENDGYSNTQIEQLEIKQKRLIDQSIQDLNESQIADITENFLA